MTAAREVIATADRTPSAGRLAGLVACLVPAVLWGQEAKDQPAVAGVQEASLPPVAEVFDARQELQEFLLSVEGIQAEAFAREQAQLVEDLEAEAERIRRLVDPAAVGSASFEALIDLRTDIRGEVARLQSLSAELTARANRRDRELDQLAEYRQRWEKIIAAAGERDAPAEVMEVARGAVPEIEEAQSRVRADRDAALASLARINRLQMSAAAFEAMLRNRSAALEAQAQQAAEAAVWDRGFWSHAIVPPEALAELERATVVLIGYLKQHGLRVVMWLAAIFGVTYWLLRVMGRHVVEYLEKDSVGLKSAAVFARPLSAAWLVALMGVEWLAPPGPLMFSRLLWALLPLPAATLAVSVFGKPIRLSLYTLALALALLQLQPLLASMPLLDRSVTVFQFLSLAAAFALDLRRGHWAQAFPGVDTGRLRLLVRLAYASFLLILLVDLAGLVGFARTLKYLVMGGLGLGMVFLAASYVLTGLVVAMLYVQPIASISVVRHRRWTIVETLKRGIRILAGVTWLAMTLQVSGLLGRVTGWAGSVLSYEFHLGAVTINLSAIAYGVLVIVATVLITRIVRFLFDNRSPEGAQAAGGVSFAISRLLQYGIAVAGFLFALAVMGFDITKVTVLAGALGVGIGFGLQNIVNNFVSGLILLFERPIKINDVTKVDDLMGTVRAMGIRSTLVETFDGAEVIVPNADFISKTVLNWTKSNRRRRAEIDVGVAYGTDSQKVLDILAEVAAGEDGVMRDPAPFAVFTGFGDSALNFRLYVWFEDLSGVLVSASRVRQRILEAFEAAGISIPFPQRDVRVISTAGPDVPGRAGPEPEPAA